MGIREQSDCAGTAGSDSTPDRSGPTQFEPFTDSVLSAIGLDDDAFGGCIEERRYKDFVQADYLAGRAAGVRGTPAFFVNGIALKGTQDVDALSGQVDQELARLDEQDEQ